MTVHANARSPFGTNYKLKRITQSGAQQWWSFKPAANNFGVGCTFVHSPQTRVRFYSSPDTTEFLTVEETPWRNCCVELLAGWNHEVSRCHSSFRRRLGELKCRKCAPSHVKFRQVCVKCGAGDSESGSSWRRVSPGPSPAYWLCGCSFPAWANATAALWQGLQIFRLLAASFNRATATPTYTPGTA